MDVVTYSDFCRLDIRVGKIMQIERVPGTEKLYKIQVDIGTEKSIQIISSLVPYYTEDELMGARIIVLVNLKPTHFRGELSEGMLLAAETDDGSECVVLTTREEIVTGARIT